MDIAQEGKSLKCSSPGRFESHPRKCFEESLEEQEQWKICMGEILGMWQREGKGEVQDNPMQMCTPGKETQNRATCCMPWLYAAVTPEQGSAALTLGIVLLLGCCPVKWPFCEALASQQAPGPDF